MSQGSVEEIMSDSENRLEHLQIENDMTNESPGNIKRTGGSEVAEDQPALGEENNILEDEHGQFRRHREDQNSNIGYQEDPASNTGRLEDQGRISPYKCLVPCLSVRVKFTNQ